MFRERSKIKYWRLIGFGLLWTIAWLYASTHISYTLWISDSHSIATWWHSYLATHFGGVTMVLRATTIGILVAGWMVIIWRATRS